MKFEVMEGSTHAERMAFAKQWLEDAAERGEKYAGKKIPSWLSNAHGRKLIREIAAQCNPNHKPPTPASIAEKALLKKFKRDRSEAERRVDEATRMPVRIHHVLGEWIDTLNDKNIDYLIPGYLRELIPTIKNLVATLEANLPRDEDGELVSWYSDHVYVGTEDQYVRMTKVVGVENARADARRAHREVVEAKREEWCEAHPGEHYPGETQYSDDGECTVIAEADPTADKRLLGIDPFPGDEDDIVEMAA